MLAELLAQLRVASGTRQPAIRNRRDVRSLIADGATPSPESPG
nr:hypothetical protein [Kibdelosporangium sp. MJ126-NF4]CTQ98319.1 hypothetical protein [Kibdelosporangium sp. MJ126-NF4]